MFDTKPTQRSFETFILEAQEIQQSRLETTLYLQSMHEAWVARQPKEDPMLVIVQQNIAEIEAMILFLKHGLFLAILALLGVMYIGVTP